MSSAHRVPSFLPGHYEHGFDSEVCAPDSDYSLFLKGGNDSNFGMTLKLPTGTTDDPDAPAVLPPDADSEDPSAFDGAFRPDSVTFFVRTDNERADAGHFILGESNEVNKRVAQFQFTKAGKMGLLGVRASACTHASPRMLTGRARARRRAARPTAPPLTSPTVGTTSSCASTGARSRRAIFGANSCSRLLRETVVDLH